MLMAKIQTKLEIQEAVLNKQGSLMGGRVLESKKHFYNRALD
jgi:hypothetical protein